MGPALWKTTSAVSPDLRRERACRMLAACCDGVLPAVNLFSKWVPTTWAMTVMPMISEDPDHQHRAAGGRSSGPASRPRRGRRLGSGSTWSIHRLRSPSRPRIHH